MAQNYLSDKDVGFGTAGDPVKTGKEQAYLSDSDVGFESTGYGLKDFGSDLASVVTKGVMAVPQAAVGLADIATGGRAGKALEDAGVRFNEANQIADSWKSDSLKAQQKEFQDAQGIGGKAVAALSNPGLIASTVAESIPSMFAGGALAKGAGLAIPALAGRAGLAAAGEGAVMAGSQAENIRQQTADGLLTPGQSALAAATGIAGGAIGTLGAKAGKALGVGDIDTMIANGATQSAREGVGLAGRVGRGALSEGVLEELPQSLTETAFGNIALDKPVTEGMDEAAVLGTLSGGVMGGAAGAMSRPWKPSQQLGIDPGAGPLSRAAAASVDSQAVQPLAPVIAEPQPLGPVASGQVRKTYAEASKDWVAGGKRGDVIREGGGFKFAAEGSPELDAWRSRLATKKPEQPNAKEAPGAIQNPAVAPTPAASTEVVGEPDSSGVSGGDGGTSTQANQPDQSSVGQPVAADKKVTPSAVLRDMAEQFRERFKTTEKETDRTFSVVLDDFAADIESGKRDPASVEGMKQRYAEILATPATKKESVSVTAPVEAEQASEEEPQAPAPRTNKLKEARNARRAADVLRTSDVPSTGAGSDISGAGVEPELGAVRGRGTDAAVTEPAAKGNAGGGAGGAAGDADALRPARWRQNALQAGKVARSLGLDPKGKRLAQIVAEIDAVDAGTNVQNTQSQPARTEAKATAVEASTADRGNAAADTGVSAAGGNAGVRADGVKVKKQTGPESVRLVVRRDIVGDKFELQGKSGNGEWEKQTTFDTDADARSALKSMGYDADSVQMLVSDWNAKAKRFNPPKPAAPGAGDVQADGVDQSQPKPEPSPEPSKDAGSVSQEKTETADSVQPAQPKEDKPAEEAPAPKKPYDAARAQELRNSIAEGELILSSGTNNGRKLTKPQLEAVRRSVESSRAKLDDLDDLDDGDAFMGVKDEDPKDLIITHNLTPENVMHAIRMGGIPVPSLAVTKKDNALSSFGSITLIGKKEMADPKGYAGTKVFGADIYSPRYPNVEYKIEGAALRSINEKLRPFLDGGREIYGGELSRLDDLTSNKAFKRFAADKLGEADQNAVGYHELKGVASALIAESGAEERIFRGYTNSGNRKYIPHTLDNVVAILKKELRGGENFSYGVGSVRAKYTPKFNSVKDIRKGRDRLVTKEEFDVIKKEVDDEFFKIGEELSVFHRANNSFGYSDAVALMMSDAAKMGIPRALEENGFEDVSPKSMETVRDYLNKLRTLPTEYFEAKILRPVALAEFAAAVVPERTNQAVIDAMRKEGITKIVTYKDDAERKEVTRKVAEELGDDAVFMGDKDAPIFYSALRKEIEGLNLKSAPFLGWHGQLQGLVRAGKVKADELEWTGISEWLKLQTGKVSKEDVLAYLDANGVQVTETVLGGDGFYRDSNGNRVFDDETGEYIGSKTPGTKYQNYTLPGGENYREVLLTLPISQAKLDAQRARRNEALNTVPRTPEAQRVLDETRDGGVPKYKSSHWDQPNVLAHIRLNDRVDADGKRVLFVEEIQSDFGQDIKKKGMASKVMTEAQRAAKLAEAKALTAGIRQRSNADRAAGLEQISDETLKLNTADSIRAGEIMRELEDDKAAALSNTGKLPRAPFVDKTDKWLALSLKRIMKMAVDGGYDRVAFVNGEQSAERYDLSKQVDYIDYVKSAPNRWNVAVVPKVGDDIQRNALTAEQLEELVGKEVAQKIVNGEGQSGGGRKTLRGLDLKVGGEGMKAFYDKIVPAAVKDVLKKVGGGQMEAVSIAAVENGLSVRPIDSPFGKFVVVDGNGKQVGLYETEAEAKAYMAQSAKPQPGFTITDSMREKVAGGLPLFAGSKSKPRTAATPVDRAVMSMAADGKSGNDILQFIANASRSPYRRQLAKKLLATGANPAVSLGGEMGGGQGFKFLAKYSRKDHEVTLSEAAADRAEQIFLHETTHAATLLALDKGGLFATQMKRLYESAKAQGGADGQYGMKNVGEFVAEAFTNPTFQKALKGMKADTGSLWDRFVAMVRRVLGLPDRQQDMLSAALELGAKVMRENMPLRAARSFRAEDGPAFAGSMKGMPDNQAPGPQGDAQQGANKGSSAPKIITGLLENSADVRPFAESLANKIKANGFVVERLEHSGSAAGPSSYLTVYDPKTGNRYTDIRVSNHSKGAYNYQFVTDIGSDEGVSSLLAFMQSRRTPEKVAAHAEYLEENRVRLNEQRAARFKMLLNSGDKKTAKGKPLTNSEREAADARSNGLDYLPSDPPQEKRSDQSAPDTDGASDDAFFGIADAVEQVKQFDVKTAPKQTLAHYRGMGLQFLGRRQLVDLYSEELPQLETYNDLVQQMDAEKNDTGAEADRVAQDWGSLKNGMDRKLAELMHDATLAKVDPDKPMPAGYFKRDYDALKARFDALSPEAKTLYRKARDMYLDHYKAVQQAIKDRVERSEMSEGQKRKMMADLDDKLFKELKGVYFPLARFGQYVIVVKDVNGEVVNVTRAETVKEAEQARKELQKAFPAHMGNTVGKVLKQAEFNAGRDAVGKGFMADLMGALDEKGVDDELRDTVAQLYLSSLPDLSWAKHGIHRKGTPGFSQDARRAFAQNMFHGARYLAKLRHADRLQDLLIEMQDHIKAYEGVEEYDSIQAQQVVDEMVKRHEWLMNPKASPVSTALTSFGFLFHMGLSPASAMVNLTQTALVAFPQMGAKWGFAKAGAALTKASEETVRARNDLSKTLNGDELDAFNRAVKDGTIDVTMAHDLAGIAQGEDQGVLWKIRPVMRWASFMFHHAEKFNRQATFLAAYRLAKEANPAATQSQLYEQAKQATYDGHFDYSSSNRARIMQGNWQRVIFLFKNYAQHMVYALARNAYQSVKALDPKERAQARKTLGGILAAHAMAAGVLGLPIVGPLLTVASWIGGDDDEPWDAEVAMQNAMADLLGPKAAEVIAHGFSRLTPFDLSGRVALNKLILPDVQEGLEGKEWAESAMAAALGPVAGIGVNVARGAQKITEGDYLRGMEDMMPTALRGPLKAMRYASEGAVDKTGITITEDVSTAGVLGQASGFSPSQVRRDTERRSAIYGYDRALLERRSVLMRMFAKAQMSGDTETAQEVRQDIQRFNEKNPTRRITPMNLAASIRNRRRRIQEAEQGVYLPSKRRDALDAVTF